jgi:hypothetical protein
MPNYRAYVVGDDGHFYKSVALDEPDDAAAITAAKHWLTVTMLSCGSVTARSPNWRRKNSSELFCCSFVLTEGNCIYG